MAFSASISVPSSLNEDVKFWEMAFSKVKYNQCIVHDSHHLDIVYEVRSIRGKTRRQQYRSRIRMIKDVKNVLFKLAKGRSASSRFEKDILQSIPRKYRYKKFYKSAAYRVRCQRGVSENFNKGLARSKKYMKMIKRLVRQKGLPEDIAYLPFLESGFNNRAHSKVGARGLWQLMKSTARENGLKVTRHRDDRVNSYLATKTALNILKKNYSKTNSWPLALTGYNYGINGIIRAIKKYGTSNYSKLRLRHKSRSFGFAAKNFFPSFIAARNLAKKYERRSNRKLALRD